MEQTPLIIPAHSRRQAMEWSLVLVSQGIETAIQGPAEEHGWQLVIQSHDQDRALQALIEYRRENKKSFWHQSLPWPGLMFDWTCLLWLALLLIVFVLGETRFPNLRAVGCMDSDAVTAGQWWRLFTAVLLHADLSHLALNLCCGLHLLGLAMGAFGPGHALLGCYLAGVGANWIDWRLNPTDHSSLGASGMIMAALGLLTAQSLALVRTGLSPKQSVVRAFLGALLLLVLLGLDPSANTNVTAHVAGFFLGCGAGVILALLPNGWTQYAWGNRLAEFLCAVLVGLTWSLALRSPPVLPPH